MGRQPRALKHCRVSITRHNAGWGFAALISGILWDNLAGLITGDQIRIEPVTFLVFLATLGCIAISRTVRREEKLITLESELDLARKIQQSILPLSEPDEPSFRVAARYLPMTDVAGDFYDYVACGSGRLAILVADVSGHGIPAALIASMLKIAAASQREHVADPALVLTKMNAALCGNTQSQFDSGLLVFG